MTALRRLAPSPELPGLAREIAAEDTMYDGRDRHYLSVGLSALGCIERALGGRTPRTILDMPCGWGRVLRVLRARYPDAAITACDLDEPGVDWTAAAFGARPVYSTPDLGQLRLPGRYDLVWVGSLVTHTSEVQTRALLRRLAGKLSRRGRLVVSSHGPTIMLGLRDWGYGLEPGDAAAVLDGYALTGYGHRPYGGAGAYGISLTDRDWWALNAGTCGLHLCDYWPQAWDDHQDIVVLRRAGWRDRPGPGTAVQRADASRDVRMTLFDAAWYLRLYPDVAQAVADGLCPNAWAHYVRVGRAEGRAMADPARGATPVPPGFRFDESWYLQTYPDVAAAAAAGREASAFDHWLRWGEAEGRLPHPAAS